MLKLSIVVPVYNVEKYINQCIDSILGQTFTDFELILVDDGSNDSSGTICDQYGKADSRVIVIHTKNCGVVSARRTGVNCARGEYTAFVDSDDWFDLEFYSSIFGEIGEKSTDVVICTRVNRATGCVKTTELNPGYYDKAELEKAVYPKMMYDMYEDSYYINPSLCNKLFRTELLLNVCSGVDPHVTLGEDAVCTYPCIARADSLIVIENKDCYNYREDHISMVNNCDIRLLQRVCALANCMNRQFSELSPSFDSQVQCFIAYNGLYAARQVLLLNREMNIIKRVKAVKSFFSESVIAHSFREASKMSCYKRLKWKLILATKNQPYILWLLLQCRSVIQKLNSILKK